MKNPLDDESVKNEEARISGYELSVVVGLRRMTYGLYTEYVIVVLVSPQPVISGFNCQIAWPTAKAWSNFRTVDSLSPTLYGTTSSSI